MPGFNARPGLNGEANPKMRDLFGLKHRGAGGPSAARRSDPARASVDATGSHISPVSTSDAAPAEPDARGTYREAAGIDRMSAVRAL